VLSFELREVLVCTQIHTPFLPQALLPLALKKKTNKTKRVWKKVSLTYSLRDYCLLPRSLVCFSFELRVVEQLISERERERERERDLGYTISLLTLTTKSRVCLNNTHPSRTHTELTPIHTLPNMGCWHFCPSFSLSSSSCLHVGGLSLTTLNLFEDQLTFFFFFCFWFFLTCT